MTGGELGLSLPVESIGVAAAIELATAAEGYGYGSVWSAEVAAADGFSPLAAIAARTTSIRLGVAVIPAGTRPVALLAMSASSLAAISGGRFVLGIGTSSSNIVEDWMASGPYAPARLRVRETIECLRLLLTGERTTYRGSRVSVVNFALTGGPAWVPILVGALTSRSYELAGEVAEGVIATLVSPEHLAALVPKLRVGAATAQRHPIDLEVTCRLVVALDEDGPDIRASLRRMLARYAVVPAYGESFVAQGFERETRAIRDAWSAGRRDAAARAVSDEMLRALTAFGDEASCFDRIRSYQSAGATTVIIAPVTAAAQPAVRRARIETTTARLAELFGACPRAPREQAADGP